MLHSDGDMYIYVLTGEKGFYVGITQNLQVRYAQHLRNKTIQVLKQVGTNPDIYHWWNTTSRYFALKIESYLHYIQRKFGNDAIYQIVQDLPSSCDLLLKEALQVKDTPYQLLFK